MCFGSLVNLNLSTDETTCEPSALAQVHGSLSWPYGLYLCASTAHIVLYQNWSLIFRRYIWWTAYIVIFAWAAERRLGNTARYSSCSSQLAAALVFEASATGIVIAEVCLATVPLAWTL